MTYLRLDLTESEASALLDVMTIVVQYEDGQIIDAIKQARGEQWADDFAGLAYKIGQAGLRHTEGDERVALALKLGSLAADLDQSRASRKDAA